MTNITAHIIQRHVRSTISGETTDRREKERRDERDREAKKREARDRQTEAEGDVHSKIQKSERASR